MNFLRNFMMGRYGPDHLNTALIITSLAVGLVARFVAFPFILYLSYLIFALALFRMLSRNIEKRRAENDRFLHFWWPFKTRCKKLIDRQKSHRTHKFFKCPSCKNTLRVPRGKGRLQVTCPKCGERFIKKT